jgi:aconitase A
MCLPILLKLGDDVSTDEIMPAGARVLPYRSNIPEIAKFVFTDIDEEYYDRYPTAPRSRFSGSANSAARRRHLKSPPSCSQGAAASTPQNSWRG